MTSSIRTCLWFRDGRGREAAEHYCSLVPGSRVETSFSGDAGHGTFSVIDFSLGGVPYQILDAGPAFALTEAVSISVATDDQAETDRLWAALTADGFFHYGPRLWMVGEVEPLKDLEDPGRRSQVIARVLKEYPERTLEKDSAFYRLRVGPRRPADPNEYDSPPTEVAGKGRLDSIGFPVLYGSQDIDICIHECRATAEDEIFVATLKPERDMRLLDLTHVLREEVTEFESLDLAIHMLFLARSHSYVISREIALSAKDAGFDGVIYPSFFSLIRTGGRPFETAYGLSLRRFHPQAEDYGRAFTIPNFALFGRPLQNRSVRVHCINRLVLTQIGYTGHFGPVAY